MVVIQTCTCFFFEVPRFEESQDPDSSPRREEVGRRTLRDYGGFLLPFFYRDRFQLCTTRKRRARKIYPNKTPITSGVEESNSPRRDCYETIAGILLGFARSITRNITRSTRILLGILREIVLREYY